MDVLVSVKASQGTWCCSWSDPLNSIEELWFGNLTLLDSISKTTLCVHSIILCMAGRCFLAQTRPQLDSSYQPWQAKALLSQSTLQFLLIKFLLEVTDLHPGVLSQMWLIRYSGLQAEVLHRATNPSS